jgi:uncharacterized protein YegJ (DUF2314 family)
MLRTIARRWRRITGGISTPVKRTLVIAVLAAAFVLPLLVSCSRSSSGDKTINVADDDPEMLVAIAKARETLPKFWDAFERRGRNETDFALKVKITDTHGTEHFWATGIERKNGKTSGTIDNDPNIVRTVKLGERIQINEADISDWFYFRDGKMVGNQTLRVLFKEMPPAEVKRYKAMLADPD